MGDQATVTTLTRSDRSIQEFIMNVLKKEDELKYTR